MQAFYRGGYWKNPCNHSGFVPFGFFGIFMSWLLFRISSPPEGKYPEQFTRTTLLGFLRLYFRLKFLQTTPSQQHSLSGSHISTRMSTTTPSIVWRHNPRQFSLFVSWQPWNFPPFIRRCVVKFRENIARWQRELNYCFKCSCQSKGSVLCLYYSMG